MSDPTSATIEATDASVNTTSQETNTRTYTQEEFDRHMAGLKASLTKKYEKTYADLGDVEELRQLKTQAEARRLEEAKKRGEFEKVLQEMASKKDAEISKRDDMIRGFKIDMPVLDAAARFRAVNPEQVKTLIRNNIRLNDEGDVEVVGDDGQVRYNDAGRPVSVDTFVQEWLQKNPHFAQATPATVNTQSSLGVGATASTKLDLSQLDLTKAEDRKIYAQARAKGLI
jgi:hypothetical protein